MALAMQRDLAALRSGVERWLAHSRQLERVVIDSCTRPSDGLSTEVLLVRAHGDGPSGPRADALALRLPPAGPGTFPRYDLALQAHVQQLVAAAGVPAPAPAELVTDETWLGTPFLAMPLVDGQVVGQSAVDDPWVAAVPEPEQRRLVDGLVDVVTAVHRVDWEPLGDVVEVRGIDAELDYWARYLDWYGDGEQLAPPLHAALEWCRAHRPPDPPHSLLWGDVRLGNLVFGRDVSVHAVLDWEMASVGAAEHDLAWHLCLTETEAALRRRSVPGFPDRASVVRRYEQRLGRSVQHLEWFEVLAMLRSTAVLSRIVWLHQRAGRPAMMPLADNPLLSLLSERIAAVAR
jgi:aminoglycoside phosphotransferase (APT) family kinase protein